jgi:NADPH-dependent glutamate synthase beta subunit-like oxidoreductase/2,4-dienoyl-CoA reductase-like NADH-dependent reductase (Old Yellow Enzyme family)
MWEFKLGGIEDLKQLASGLGVRLDAIEDVSILKEEVRAGGLVMPNSLAVHPMEGCDGDSEGRPGKLTVRRYQRFAAGGAGLIWGEATAVVGEARANPRQLWFNEKSKDSFGELIAMMRQVAAESMGPGHRPVIVAQLTHSGRYSRPGGDGGPMIAQRDPYRDALVPQIEPNPNAKSKIPDDWPIVTDEYLDKLQDSYVEAARIAFEAGFDAVDVKSCHGYLINELFACHNREGKYGGSFENRTRFLLEVIDKIHRELGEDKPITTRMGIYDAIPYPYGWGVDKDDYTKPDLTEPKKLIALLRERGVKLINITIANPYYNPHIVGTGYSWLRTLVANVGAASKANGLASIVGVGRMGFAYPDYAKDIITKGRMLAEKVCVSCSACTQIMRDHGMTGCVVRDNEVYGPIFMHGRMSDRENLVRLASECRKCQEPTCRLGCPAGVNIPKFIGLFLDGKDQAAYEVLREANVFAEVCAWLCPVEQQCEGSCLQKFIGDGALPIAEIQRYLAEQANKNGWSKLCIPEKGTGKNIAVIGAGPAGLACAAGLLEAGHAVTVFDGSTELGGTVESVIPEERQSDSLRNEISAVFADVPDERLLKRLGKELSAEFNLDTIMAEGFDAIFIGMGLTKSVSISNENVDGLWNAMEFLSAAREGGKLNVAGESVAAIGGGNTAMDVAITARQLDAKDVYVVYRRSFKEMPAWSAERDQAIKEGVHFLILTQLLGVNSSSGKVAGITVCPTKLGEPDETGRRRPEPIESSAYELDMDIVVEAIGQKSAEEIGEILPGVELENGLIHTQEDSLATSKAGVFAGGDLVRGASTVVAAVADGMKAAKEIDKFLRQ